MTTRDDAPAGDSAVAGTPSGLAQRGTDTDAADPAAPGKHRAQCIGSAGGGPYPIGTGSSNDRTVTEGGADPALLLTETEPMTDVMAAYREFDQRQPGWRKVAINPAA
jgi:threonine dehydrogenase-like Zn-dependent dehydrogenase